MSAQFANLPRVQSAHDSSLPVEPKEDASEFSLDEMTPERYAKRRAKMDARQAIYAVWLEERSSGR